MKSMQIDKIRKGTKEEFVKASSIERYNLTQGEATKYNIERHLDGVKKFKQKIFGDESLLEYLERSFTESSKFIKEEKVKSLDELSRYLIEIGATENKGEAKNFIPMLYNQKLYYDLHGLKKGDYLDHGSYIMLEKIIRPENTDKIKIFKDKNLEVLNN